jgi:hypothetical protein
MSLPQTRSESRSLVNGRPDRQAVPARGVPSVRSLRNLQCTLCRMNLNIPQTAGQTGGWSLLDPIGSFLRGKAGG